MVYRETDRMRARKATVRRKILLAARDLIAQGGYRSVRMARVAECAEVATGSLYRYFHSKSDLFTQVFEMVSTHEIVVLAKAAGSGGSCRSRLEAAIRTFAENAFQRPRLAYAMMAEPVDPSVEAARLRHRRAYARVFERLLEEGIARGEFPKQDPAISAAAIVGLMAETLIGPLSKTPPASPNGGHCDEAGEALLGAILSFALRGVTGSPIDLSRTEGAGG
ncbi:MAG: TetR/AcrR family transcriptional regulator [Deltaproteobacteria bacterium]|nr:MAG: TetR/AcrR family transcriptional regulator [Deltaproteobacteria bacterium]